MSSKEQRRHGHEELRLNTFDVGAGFHVDFDFVALTNEGGNLNFGSAISRRRFGHIGGSIAFGCGFCVGDFHDHLLRWSHADELSIPEQQLHRGTFDQEDHLVAADAGW